MNAYFPHIIFCRKSPVHIICVVHIIYQNLDSSTFLRECESENSHHSLSSLKLSNRHFQSNCFIIVQTLKTGNEGVGGRKGSGKDYTQYVYDKL